MFGNLVQIELIRLLKNKTLKICAPIGTIMVIFIIAVTEFLAAFGALETEQLRAITVAEFRGIMLTTTFSIVMSLVMPVTVVYRS